MNQPCPCFSRLPYNECCKKYHKGESTETALKLMRSRYSAYALSLPDYIILTTHPQNSSYQSDTISWKKQILDFCKNTTFIRLDILSHEELEDCSYVTFKATLKQKNKDASFTERSRFEKLNDRWLYHSGEFLTDKISF